MVILAIAVLATDWMIITIVIAQTMPGPTCQIETDRFRSSTESCDPTNVAAAVRGSRPTQPPKRYVAHVMRSEARNRF